GDPATRRPGDPATRRPGDPATGVAAPCAAVKPNLEHKRPAPPARARTAADAADANERT
ncbi:MAG: flavohemoprotein, partial [Boseongicola sp. SB0675_bin_26]|nr:flavohemoprotein [Boseongicola sp. SB0675_bin_26]